MAVAVDSLPVELLIIVLTVPSLERVRSDRLLLVGLPVSYFSWSGWL